MGGPTVLLLLVYLDWGGGEAPAIGSWPHYAWEEPISSRGRPATHLCLQSCCISGPPHGRAPRRTPCLSERLLLSSKGWWNRDRTSNDRTSKDRTSKDWTSKDRTSKDWTSKRTEHRKTEHRMGPNIERPNLESDRTSKDWTSKDRTSNGTEPRKTEHRKGPNIERLNIEKDM